MIIIIFRMHDAFGLGFSSVPNYCTFKVTIEFTFKINVYLFISCVAVLINFVGHILQAIASMPRWYICIYFELYAAC